MRSKFLFAPGLVAAIVAFVVAPLPASASSSGTLNATVTVASPCILLDKDAVDFGSLGFSSTTTPTNGTKTAQLTNCGGQAEDILARGSDAVDSSSLPLWTLWGTSNQVNPCALGPGYFFQWSAIDGYANPNPTWSLVSSVEHVIASRVAAGTPNTLEATVTMPCSGSGGAGATAHFSFIYTASF